MSVIGLTPKCTVTGKHLKDGGSCLITDKKEVIAVSEERISHIKYDGGYENSLNFLEEAYSVDWKNVDSVASSTCCEPEQSFSLKQCKHSMSVNHHLSHATLAIHTSPFDSALVVVIDGGGNVLEPMGSDGWWEHNREQHSYYSFSDDGLELISRDFSAPYEFGLGEFWRAVTYATGFGSSIYAAKVMEMSGMGKPLRTPSPFNFSKDAMVSELKYIPGKPLQSLELFLGQDEPISFSNLPLMQLGHKIELSAWAQKVLEDSVIEKLVSLKKASGHNNLCLGGGVFLNCKLIERICRENIFNNVHVSFAPSDKGQCVGNALYAAKQVGLIDYKYRFTSPFIGPHDPASYSEIKSHVDGRNTYLYNRKMDNDCLSELINSGAIIGVCSGRSEFGARALGNRSIIASPYINRNKKRLNEIKGRESYTPVAPSVSEDMCAHYFSPEYLSPYMERIFFKKQMKEHKNDYEAVFHQDGSARVQTIGNDSGSFMSGFIKDCRGHLLLNTSFNSSGRPIVERPNDAIDEFFNLQLDALFMDHGVMWKKSALYDSIIANCSDEDWLFFNRFPRHKANQSLKKVLSAASALPGINTIDWRESFSLYNNYINWLEEGRKVTTIRFIPNGLSIPTNQTLPLIRTSDFTQVHMNLESKSICLRGFGVKQFKDLKLVDAMRDGFQSTSQLKKMLKRIYPLMQPDSYVSINFIEFVENHKG